MVNADAMQLYRGMDIGTAKLPPAERRGIPHHQLDVLDVTEEAASPAYQAAARADLDRDPAPRAPAGARRRLGALRAGRAGPAGDPAAPTPRCARALEAEARGGRRRRRCAPGWRAGPRGRRRDRAQQRPAHRARARGHRADRAAVLGDHADPRVRAPTVLVGLAAPTAPRSTSGSRTGCDRMWAAGLLDEVRGLVERRPARGPHRVAGRSATRRPWPQLDGAADRRARRASETARHPAVGPAAGVVVRPRPADRLARRRTSPTWSSAAARRWSAPRSGQWRRWLTRPALHQGARHGERLRPRARPRGRSASSTAERCAGSPTGAPASAVTA